MQISLLPKKKRRRKLRLDLSVIKKSKDINLAFGILVLIFVIYGALSFYIEVLNKEIEELNIAAKNIQAQRDNEAEDAVIEFDRKLTNLASLVDNHIYSSKVFTFLEENTHPRAQFTDFNFDIAGNKIILNGLTDGYESFGEQIIAFKQNEKISNLEISSVNLLKIGKVAFGITFEIEENVYK